LAVSLNVCAFAKEPGEVIHALVSRQHENRQFNGNILVAREGNVVYRHAFSAAGKEPNTLETPSNIASVTKQFTAMAIMILAERGKLHYDDPASRHIPGLSKLTREVTLRHLLTHTSGIPDVGDLGIDKPRLREEEVLKAVIAQQADFAKPGAKYRYSNAGYVLLAMVVENASGKPFGRFLQEIIFAPLGMSHTQLSKDSDKRGYAKGDSGILSTVDDLLKWDQALYTDQLVRQATLDEAFTPGRVQEGKSTYGFGWNIMQPDGTRYVWHTGNTANFRAFIGRRLEQRLTVIILTNLGNSRRLEISEAIFNILNGKPYAEPKLSIAASMDRTLRANGIEAALEFYASERSRDATVYDFAESELNALGYQLLGRKETGNAVRVFELNTLQYPQSSNAFDSLGEAYHQSGKKELAVKAYRRSVELDPNNLNALKILRRLESIE